jgi:hypothetical protein
MLHAKGMYLAFLDADDYMYPRTLEMIYDLIMGTGATILAGKRVEFTTGVPSIESDSYHAPEFKLFDHPLDAFSKSGYYLYAPSAMVLRTDMATNAGGFAEGRINGEDAHLIMKLGTSGKVCIVFDPVCSAYRRHDSNSVLSPMRTYKGMIFLQTQEKQGAYPGRGRLQLDRWKILSAHSRSSSILCGRSGYWRRGFHLYALFFGIHLRLCRFKYLAGYPVCALYWIVCSTCSMRFKRNSKKNK